ncbi:MAG: gliding motility-associated C-terminal domain-containing protein [Bacteroidales bacterium]|nr:gliding motility-associated C-terminal domain-containing protein [Bacteroidales bacterium]
MKRIHLLIMIAGLLAVLGYDAKGQASELSALPAGTPWIWSDYVDPSLADDKVFIFCSPNSNGDSVLGTLSVTGGSSTCVYDWQRYNPATSQFVSFGGPLDVGTSSTQTGLTSGFYQVVITCYPNTQNEQKYCRRAHVFVNNSIVDFNAISAGCNPFSLTGGVIGPVSDFVVYDPPATPFNVTASTDVTVCFWIDHSFVSDLGFYLIGPNGARIDLLPPVAAWDNPGVTTLDASVVLPNPCATTSLNLPCNEGNDYNNFCFTSALPAGNPTYTPCICSMSLVGPLTGTYASCDGWNAIYGQSAADGGWAVQIFDCFGADVGSLQRVTITFDGDGVCGAATYTYDSGLIDVQITDASCDSASAATYVVPMKTTSHHTITNTVTAHWESFPTAWNPVWGSTEFVSGVNPLISPAPTISTDFSLVIEDHLFDALGNEILPTASYAPCSPSKTHTFITLPTDASVLNPPTDLCQNSNGVQLQALYPNGTWSSLTAPGSITPNGYFFPGIAPIGPNTIKHQFTGVCADDTTFVIWIVDEPNVLSTADTICNGSGTAFKVQIELTGGSPGTYTFTNPTTGATLTGLLAGTGSNGGTIWTSDWIPSPSIWQIGVTDINDCNPQVVNGFQNCACISAAASMPLTLLQKCVYEPAIVQHNNNYHLDSDDTWAYIMHTEPYGTLGTVLAQNTNGIFYFTPGTMNYNQTYYISHVVADNIGSAAAPNIDLTDDCRSVSPGTPVEWFENPSPEAGLSKSTCGNTITMGADVPTVGQGAWSSLNTFGVIYYPNYGTPNTQITVPNFDTNAYGCPINTTYSFRWTVTNGPCTVFDDVNMQFKPVPSAFAGVSHSVCGLQDTLSAIYSLCGPLGVSEGWWSGDASFQNSLSPNSVVNVIQPGCYNLIWTEFNEECRTSSYVQVCFINNPVVDANHNDSVCKLSTDLHAISTMGYGLWTGPLNTIFTNPTNPETDVVISMPVGLTEITSTFTWTEHNTQNGITCSASDDVNITFSLEPTAAAGFDDETCDTSYTLDADIFGFEYALGTWKSNFVGTQFNNLHYAGATVTIPNTGVMPGQPNNGSTFGDSSWVTIPIVWVLDNNRCFTEDTVLITFYQMPRADAGPDTSVCGKSYVMKGKYSIGESKGEWSMISGPSPLQPTWSNKFSPTSTVTVPVSGQYVFQWKEDNFHNQTCSDVETVDIFFIEIPDVSAGFDRYICGNDFVLEASASTGNGIWLPTTANIVTPSDPHSATHYGGSSTNFTVTYVWQEYNENGNIQCVENDSVYITYMVQPTANVLWTPGVSIDHVCGKVETNAEQIVVGQNPSISGTNIISYWTGNDAQFYKAGVSNPFARDPDSVVVGNYGVHNFNWVVENWVGDSVCADTSDITIIVDFIEQPVANPGFLADTACCDSTVGYFWPLYSQFSTTTGDSSFGSWFTISPNQIEFVYLIPGVDTVPIPSGQPIYADSLQWVTVHLSESVDIVPPKLYDFTWIEYNYGELGDQCSDQASTNITFAKRPKGTVELKYPPHCIGMEAKVQASEDLQLIAWDWSDLGGGVITHVDGTGTPENPGPGPVYVRWPGAGAGQEHGIRLITENVWKCRSQNQPYKIYEPNKVGVEKDSIAATCGELNGEILLAPEVPTDVFTYGWLVDTLAAPSSWVNPNASHQTGLKNGDYLFWARGISKITPNPVPGGTEVIYCQDTFKIHVSDTGYVAAQYQLSSVFDTTGVSPHTITLNNFSFMTDSNYISPGYLNAVDAAGLLPPTDEIDADYMWRFYRIPLDSVFDWYAPIIIKPSDLPILVGKDEIIEDMSPVLTFELAGYYYFQMIATSEYGCKDTIVGGYIKTEAKPTLTPGVNVITPNGDGINDYLEFEAMSLRSMKGVIFNRWGQKIYEWTWNEETQEPEPGWWDGKLSTGQDAPPGVYYYLIEGIGQKDQDFSGKEYSGFFHLIRDKQ